MENFNGIIGGEVRLNGLLRAMLHRDNVKLSDEFKNNNEELLENISDNLIIQRIDLDGNIDLFDVENSEVLYDFSPNDMILI